MTNHAVVSILEIQDLQVQRQGLPVLEINELDVRQGEVLAVIGPNGAGKSTLLLTLSRLLKPNRGEIFFWGHPLSNINDLDYRRHIALVLQEPLLTDATVFDNVAAGLRYRNTPKKEIAKQVNEWLNRLGIDHLRDRPARKISGGEAQRVSLARAFVLQPEVLLLDEPFTSLDSPTRSSLLLDLQNLLELTGITTIFITHDLDEALFLADRVAVLLRGRLRQVGQPNEVFTAPADNDVATFVGVENVIPGKVTNLVNGVVVIESMEFSFEAIGDVAKGRDVFVCVRPEDVTLWPDLVVPVSSARNRVTGQIKRLSPQGPLVQVEIDCGFSLKALITRASVNDMNFAEGSIVTATFKASAVHLIPK